MLSGIDLVNVWIQTWLKGGFCFRMRCLKKYNVIAIHAVRASMKSIVVCIFGVSPCLPFGWPAHQIAEIRLLAQGTTPKPH
jgi:hypothetical protein